MSCTAPATQSAVNTLRKTGTPDRSGKWQGDAGGVALPGGRPAPGGDGNARRICGLRNLRCNYGSGAPLGAKNVLIVPHVNHGRWLTHRRNDARCLVFAAADMQFPIAGPHEATKVCNRLGKTRQIVRRNGQRHVFRRSCSHFLGCLRSQFGAPCIEPCQVASRSSSGAKARACVKNCRARSWSSRSSASSRLTMDQDPSTPRCSARLPDWRSRSITQQSSGS